MRITAVLLYLYIHGSILGTDGKRRDYKATEHGDRTREYTQTWYNETECEKRVYERREAKGKKTRIESQSVWGRFSLLGWSVRVLLFRLASLGTTSRPLSRLRGWSGLRFPSCGCTFGRVGGTCRSGTIDSGVRTFIGVDLADVRIASELLVHEPRGIDQYTRKVYEKGEDD